MLTFRWVALLWSYKTEDDYLHVMVVEICLEVVHDMHFLWSDKVSICASNIEAGYITPDILSFP